MCFNPLAKQLLERDLNPFIQPKHGKVDSSMVNWHMIEYAFDAHQELKDCVVKKDIYMSANSYTQQKECIKQLDIHDDLVAKYVTGYDADGSALTRVRNLFQLVG